MMYLNKMLKDIFICSIYLAVFNPKTEYIKRGNQNVKREEEIEINKRRQRNITTIYSVTSVNKCA